MRSLLACIAAFMFLFAGTPSASEPPWTKFSNSHEILLDGIHAHNFLQQGLSQFNRDYHSLFGLKDALEFLQSQGFGLNELRTGAITPQALAASDTLLISLVSDNLPPFLVEEILAIEHFVRNGGNILVLTDHSNTYHHVWKLLPLFKVLGIRLYNESVLEKAPFKVGPGPGWINISRFKPHPVSANLSVIGFHTGGPVDEQGGIAFSSEFSWGDKWGTAPYGENSLTFGNRGNYGNFVQDPGERKGPLSVIMARQIDKGKVVVIGDQNVFGNLWIRYGDNYRLFMNVFHWFSGKNSLLNYDVFLSEADRRILLLDNLRDSRFGDYGENGLYHAYTLLSRRYDTYISDRIEHNFDLILASPSITDFNEWQVKALKRHLAQGKQLIILADSKNRILHKQLSSSTNSTADGITRLENYLRFGNNSLASPTKSPTPKQAKAAAQWYDYIKQFL